MATDTPGNAPSLTIAIATMGPRCHAVTLPDPSPGIDYVITLQEPGPVPDRLVRPDTRVLECPDRGLSRNRNAGLDAATGDLVLFSDDDITLAPQGLQLMRAAFASDPEMALALGWRLEAMPADALRAPLSKWNAGRAHVPGIVIRRVPVQACDVRFDPAFGVGAEYPIGEDYIFVTDLLAAGLKGVSLPIVTGSHPDASSGVDWRDPAIMQARHRMLARVFGRAAALIRPLYAAKHAHRFATKSDALGFALGRPPGM